MSVFISWRGSDRDTKNAIVSALRAGLPEEKIWESDEDCLSDFSKECIENVRRCEVFIAIISDASMEPSYMLNEIIEARSCEMRGSLNIVVYKITDSEYTPEFAANINHISDVNRIARMAGTDDGISALVSRVKYLLARRRSNDPEKPYDVFEPIIEGAHLGRSGYFVPDSRNVIFSEIDEGFETSNIVIVKYMDGYGRRSAVRKYAETHRGEYKNIIILHLFRGSLREFFTEGLNFSNINANTFDNIDEDRIILKKAELLSKLDKKTLLIVPNLEPDMRDDPFVLDVLAELPCRIIFIAHSVTPRIKDRFPAVTVGSMEKAHLKELFFHYYDIASEDEQDALDDTLFGFFDKLDGHTKSVEITAMTLAEEIGVYPENLADILESIRPDSNNELSDRIFGLISDMFDMRKYSETDRKILLIAALVLFQPMDEREFADTLKECGVLQTGSVKKLAENLWLTIDRENRTVSMESLMADVCLSKIPMDDEIAGKLICRLTGEHSIYLFSREILKSKRNLKRIHSLLEKRNLRSTAKLTDMYLSCIFIDINNTDSNKLQGLISEAKQEADRLENEALRLQLTLYIDMLQSSSMAISLLSGDSANDIEDQLAVLFQEESRAIMEAINSLSDDTDSDFESELARDFLMLSRGMIGARPNQMIAMFLAYFERLAESEDKLKNIGDDERLIIEYVLLLAQGMANICSRNSYLCYRFFRTYIRIRDISETFVSGSEMYTANKVYVFAMIRAGIFTEELDAAFENALGWGITNHDTIFEDEKQAEADLNGFVLEYAQAIAEKGDLYAVEEIYGLVSNITSELSCMSERTAALLVETANKIAHAYIARGDMQSAVDFLEEVLVEELYEMLKEDQDRELFAEMRDILGLLKDPDTDHGFGDGYAEGCDYYKVFAESASEKLALSIYNDVAEKTRRIDLSRLTDEELAKKAADIRLRANNCKKWRIIAPEVFALVSEAGYRVLGYRHHFVQYVGAAAMMDEKIAEIQNGEGKTYTIVLTAALRAFLGEKVHILDSSSYLTERNYTWMRGVFEMLGIDVGLLTDEKYNKRLSESLAKFDVIYATSPAMMFFREREELGNYDFGLKYETVIVDEADYLLFENGTKPIVIVRTTGEKTDSRRSEIYDIISTLSPNDTNYFEINNRYPVIKPDLHLLIEDHLGVSEEKMTMTSFSEIESLVIGCLRSLFVYENGVDYHIIDRQILFEDTTMGTFYAPSADYNYFLRRKEGLFADARSEQEKVIEMNNYNIVEFISRYEHISGTTATARSWDKEFKAIYGLPIISVPTNLPVARVNHLPKVFANEKAKNGYVLDLVRQKNTVGQPVLIVTGSIDESEYIYKALRISGIPCTLLNAKNKADEAYIFGEAGRLGKVTVSTALANRGVDILLGGNPFDMAKRHLLRAGVNQNDLNDAIYRLNKQDQASVALRNDYDRLVSYYKGTIKAEKEKVEQLGGLCVIGSRCFDSLAVEQQVRGRSGRQGAKGESHICYSISDNTLRQLFGNNYQSIVNMYTTLDIDEIESRLLTNAIRSSRKKLQLEEQKRLLNSPNILYYKQAREVIIGLMERICTGKLGFKQALKECFGKKRDEYAVYIRRLEEREEKDGLLTDKAAASRLKYYLPDMWEKYLTQMKQETLKAEVLYGDQKQRRKHLSSFSEKMSADLAAQALKQTLAALLAPKSDKLV